MDRRGFLAALGFLDAPLRASAQQAVKVPLIGTNTAGLIRHRERWRRSGGHVLRRPWSWTAPGCPSLPCSTSRAAMTEVLLAKGLISEEELGAALNVAAARRAVDANLLDPVPAPSVPRPTAKRGRRESEDRVSRNRLAGSIGRFRA